MAILCFRCRILWHLPKSGSPLQAARSTRSLIFEPSAHSNRLGAPREVQVKAGKNPHSSRYSGDFGFKEGCLRFSQKRGLRRPSEGMHTATK